MAGAGAGYLPDPRTSAALYLLVAGFLVTSFALDRNVYCLYACPFGAAQREAGLIGGTRWKIPWCAHWCPMRTFENGVRAFHGIFRARAGTVDLERAPESRPAWQGGLALLLVVGVVALILGILVQNFFLGSYVR